MAKLVDIRGYWDMSGFYDFSDINMWEGKLLLEDDGWFEGIVNDLSSTEYDGDRLIFGVYHPLKVIELLKVSPKEVSDPFVFRGRRDAKGYDGEFSLIAPFGELPYGVSHLITQHVEEEKAEGSKEHDDRDVEKEKEELKARIAAFKENNESILYDRSVKLRSNMTAIILKEYEEGKLSKEDAQRCVEPVSEDVENDIEMALRRILDNGELPF